MLGGQSAESAVMIFPPCVWCQFPCFLFGFRFPCFPCCSFFFFLFSRYRRRNAMGNQSRIIKITSGVGDASFFENVDGAKCQKSIRANIASRRAFWTRRGCKRASNAMLTEENRKEKKQTNETKDGKFEIKSGRVLFFDRAKRRRRRRRRKNEAAGEEKKAGRGSRIRRRGKRRSAGEEEKRAIGEKRQRLWLREGTEQESAHERPGSLAPSTCKYTRAVQPRGVTAAVLAGRYPVPGQALKGTTRANSSS